MLAQPLRLFEVRFDRHDFANRIASHHPISGSRTRPSVKPSGSSSSAGPRMASFSTLCFGSWLSVTCPCRESGRQRLDASLNLFVAVSSSLLQTRSRNSPKDWSCNCRGGLKSSSLQQAPYSDNDACYALLSCPIGFGFGYCGSRCRRRLISNTRREHRSPTSSFKLSPSAACQSRPPRAAFNDSRLRFTLAGV